MLSGAHIKLSSVATLLVVAGGILLALKGTHGALSDGPVASEAEPGRGRDANVPEAIPVKGLRDVFWRLVHEVSDDRVTLIAAGVTFYLLLALFPSLSALVALYGLIADPATVADHLRELSGLLPPGAFDLIADRIKSLAESRSSTLGITFFVGLAIALWSTHSGTLAVFDAMNVAYEEREKRGLIKLNLIGLCFTRRDAFCRHNDSARRHHACGAFLSLARPVQGAHGPASEVAHYALDRGGQRPPLYTASVQAASPQSSDG